MAMALKLLPLLLLYGFFSANSFKIREATIKDIQSAFSRNKLTSRQLVDFYLNQIEALNPELRGVIEVNPDARHQADKADKDIKCKKELGELHGIPVLLKDSINTKDKLNTTAGSYALLGADVSEDAGVVAKLRKAGAVILGKASMSEWYHFRSSSIPQGWCARSGQGVNPYLASGDPCGSSSGSAISVAANMAAVSLGTQTEGSIICPADFNSVVGLKPTVGLTSRAGVLPISTRQDSIGPMCRTVSDAVYVLDAIVGFDPNDSQATREASKFIPAGGYKQFLNKNGLTGKRLGVIRNPFSGSYNGSTAISVFEAHLKTLRKRGAILVDNLEIENIEIILNPYQSGEATALLAEFKLNIKEYLEEFTSSPVRSLADIIAFNLKNSDLEKTDEFGQEILIASEMTNGIGEQERAAMEMLANLSRNGFEKLMKENGLDATVTLGPGMTTVLDIGGYPGITVPAGYDGDGMPFGICFGGLKGMEPIRKPPPV